MFGVVSFNLCDRGLKSDISLSGLRSGFSDPLKPRGFLDVLAVFFVVVVFHLKY